MRDSTLYKPLNLFFRFTGPFLQQIHQVYYIIKLFTFPKEIGFVYKPSYCYSHTVLKQQHNTLFQYLKMTTLYSNSFMKSGNK